MFQNHKKNIFIIFLLTLVFGWQLFRPGFFSTHDDMQIMRQFEMNRCFQNGQVPCRWSAELGAGYGQPMFNYYSVFPYMFGQIFYQFGLTFTSTIKIIFLSTLIFSGVFSYIFLAEIVSGMSALVGAAVYLIVPFRALEIFVRGSLSEAMALSLAPLVLYYVVKISKSTSPVNVAGLAISLGLFLITHNITTILFIPFLILVAIMSFVLHKASAKQLQLLFFSLAIAAGISAFFTLPVALERGLIQTGYLTQNYFDFRAHFVSLYQLFISTKWGYGPSVFGTSDNLSFAIGTIQTLFILVTPVVFFVNRKRNHQLLMFGSVVWIFTLLTIFLTHGQSVFIWNSLPFMSYVQFPWRLLGMTVLGVSIFSAITFEILPKKIHEKLALVILLFLIIFNFKFFKFDKYLPGATDSSLLTAQSFATQQMSALTDYLPIAVKKVPTALAPELPTTKSTRVNINKFEKRSNYFNAEFDVYEDNVEIVFPIVYFPVWHIYHNHLGSYFPFEYQNDLGLITVKLDKGHHVIQGFVESTKIQLVGNLLTFLSLAVLLLYVLYIKHEE